MAPSSPEAPSIDEIHRSKRHLKLSRLNKKPGKFSELFPGLYPTHIQRQQYVNAFLRWYFGDTHFDFFHIQLAQTADSDVVDRFIELKLEPASPSAFEFLVDQVFWELHFCWLPPEERPPWPWMSVETVPKDDNLSDRFSWLKSEWKGKRSLRPPETRHKAAFPPRVMLNLEHLENF
ncbi:hypothetical protein NW768_004060 [Fusarium equiseti]|uniref:Uncharacterized protein n=1 Tax=Fusarium equiseti TaxID=61235 RepID=A0ABQ8RJH2_FUSEQ|nr:hypothetical protein NW768_004060 [Fusarium equiseti]